MKINDYKNYDSLTLYVKKEMLEEITNRYLIFGWEVSDKKENTTYEDIIDVTFVRPHKIKNKDDLQFYQVHMEETLNDSAKLDRNKNSKTTVFGLCIGAIVVALIWFGVSFFIQKTTTLQFIVGIVMIILGILLLVLELIYLPKLYRKEKQDYINKKQKIETELEEICNKAKKLTEGKNE